MAFVCVSHFALTYFQDGVADPRRASMRTGGLVATPAFVLVSGVVLGYLLTRSPGRSREIRLHLLDRGLFLLLVAHPIILLAHVPHAGSLHDAALWSFITDTIAVCMVVAPPLVQRLSSGWRLTLAAALYAVGWMAVSAPVPDGWPTALKEVLVGAEKLDALEYVFPVVPWVAVYLAATVLGEALGRMPRDRTGRTLARLALASFGAGSAWHFLHVALIRVPALRGHPVILALTSSWQKLPPGVVYLALYGGISLVILAALATLEAKGRLPGFRRAAAMVGRNSLAAFVAQYFVYYTGMVLIHPVPGAAWPLWLAGSMAVVYAATATFDRLDGNRLITVGIRRWVRRHGASVAASGWGGRG